jgi:hypothetical protein
MTATDTPPPTRRVLINLGQSNGTAVADAKSFEDANPQIALRNPASIASSSGQFSQGATADQITLPDPEFGPYRTISYRGRGSLNVRYLTFFNPVSTCVERATASVNAPTYPGFFEVTAVVTASTFRTSLIWQFDPSAKVAMTRLSTGEVRGIISAAAIPGTEITTGTNFTTPLKVGERFSFTIAAGQNSASTSTVSFYNQFGGRHDIGGVFEAQLNGLAGPYPTAVVNTFTVSVWQATFAADGANPGKCLCVEHAMYVGRKVRFSARSGTLPVDALTTLALSPSQDYYVTRIATPSDASPSTHYTFYISATPSGAEITFSSVATVDAIMAMLPDGRDSSLYGMNLRCLTGTNAGEVRALGAITQSGSVWTCALQTAFTGVPQQDDTFQLEPPDVEGTSVAWAEWAYFLPVCQFDGRGQGLPAQTPVTVTPGTETTFIADDASFPVFGAVPYYNGCPVRFYRRVFVDAAGSASGQAWPTGLLEGKTYYVINSDSTAKTFQVSASYDGPQITLTGAVAVHWVQMAETWLQKFNPAPPGFNYNNQRCVPRIYQPYSGSVDALSPTEPVVAYHWGLAQRLSEVLGEDIYVIDLAVGGSTLSQVDVPPSVNNAGIGWFDPQSMTHWAPGPTSLFARFLSVLNAAEIAAEREGVSLEAVAVVFPQAESDSTTSDRAGRYYDNLESFKRRVRAELHRRGMWPKEPSMLPFLQPKVRTVSGKWPLGATTNAAIERSANGDPFGRTWSTEEYSVVADGVHYTGASMDLLAKTALGHILDLRRTSDVELRICRLALRLAGERSGITSIYPADGSEESAMCAAFYPEVRDQLLEDHAWDFSVRNVVLIETTNERSDWGHAFLLPDNNNGIIGLGEDILSVYDLRALKFKFSIELNAESQRVLYANQPPPMVARFKAKLVDPSMFSNSFVNAAAYGMAARIVLTTMKGEEGLKAAEVFETKAKSMFRVSASNDANHTRETSQSQQAGWRR